MSDGWSRISVRESLHPGSITKLNPAATGLAVVQMSSEVNPGNEETSGHRNLFNTVFSDFQRAGYESREPVHSGRRTPDGLIEGKAEPRKNPKDTRLTFDEVFGDGSFMVRIQSSPVSKPVDLLLDLAAAVNTDRRCVIVVPGGDGENRTRRAKDVVASLRGRNMAELALAEGDDSHIGVAQYAEDGLHLYHDSERKLRVEGREVVQRAIPSPCMWFQKQSGEVVYSQVKTNSGIDGGYLARFRDHEALEAGDAEHVEGVVERTEQGIQVIDRNGDKHHYESREMLKTEWETVPKPFIPEIAFNRVPTGRDYVIVTAETGSIKETEASHLKQYDPDTDDTSRIYF